jgi:chitin synthase
MYYFLGHRLMDLPISVNRKEVIAENTYLLALDGDIDFKPCAVTLLIDLMKKNNKLGAACGRIHPVGTGALSQTNIQSILIARYCFCASIT